MIKFTCPGCHCAHQANDAFANRRAKCVRCGATIVIPQHDGVAWYSEEATELPDGTEIASNEPMDEEIEEQFEEPAPPRKSKRALIVAILAFLLIGGAVYYFVLMGDAPPPAKKAVVAIEEDKPELPAVIVPPVETKIVPVVVVATPDPIQINADRLALELIQDPKATDAKYANKLLEVQGNCLSFLVAKLEFQTATAGGDVAVGGIKAVLPEFLNRFAEDKEQPMALLGGMVLVSLTPPDDKPKPGKPVAVRGVYWGSGNLKEARLVRLSSPADTRYLRKPVLIEGEVFGVSESDNGSAEVLFYLPTTVPLVNLSCRFLVSTSPEALKLKRGQKVVIGGTCSGRDWTTVRLDNCSIGNPPGNGGPPISVTTNQLISDYEADLLRYPPIPADSPPIRVTAEQLANAYRLNAKEAEERFAMKRLIVSGYLLPREPRGSTVKFETGTDSGKIEVKAAMLPVEYSHLPTDEPELCLLGNFYGKGSSSVLQLEDARYFDPDSANSNVQRLTADYFPMEANRTWNVLRVNFTEPPSAPVKLPKFGPKPKPIEHVVTKLHYRINSDKVLQTLQLQAGTIPFESAFPDASAVKWVGKPMPLTSPFVPIIETIKLRTTDWFVEYGTRTPKTDDERPASVPGTDPKDAGLNWQPLLRLNSKLGRVWSYELAPGVRVQTAVESFGNDSTGRPSVRLLSTLTDDKVKSRQIETAVTLVKGVGEVLRVVTLHDGDSSRVVMEQRIESESKPAELKSTGSKGKN